MPKVVNHILASSMAVASWYFGSAFITWSVWWPPTVDGPSRFFALVFLALGIAAANLILVELSDD
jgi:hypothetical protein